MVTDVKNRWVLKSIENDLYICCGPYSKYLVVAEQWA